MTSKTYKILICDDDMSFAQKLKETFSRKTKLLYAEQNTFFEFHIVTVFDELVKLANSPEDAQNFDVIFCDLGWGDQNLAGIQILNDFQLSHPYGKTVLFTAQDEDDIISQTLEWKLHFIDQVVSIHGENYLQTLFEVIENLFEQTFAEQPGVHFKGKRLISNESHAKFCETELLKIQNLQNSLNAFFSQCEEPLALTVNFDHNHVQIQFKASSESKANKRYLELINNFERFSRLELHEVLGLSKPKYFEFIKKTYGGFPEMAKARFLDLNNIYRVNRRFKNSEIIVFQFETILEIIGAKNAEDAHKTLRPLLADTNQLKSLVEK